MKCVSQARYNAAMSEGDSDEATAQGIAIQRWGACDEVRLLGEGSNNVVFLAQGGDETVAIKISRPHREWGAIAEFRKEQWCADAARAAGVRTPRVLEFGSFQKRSFALQEFAAGAAPAATQALSTWRALGAAARRINAIAVPGWGVTVNSDCVFNESWQTHLDYNIRSLTAGDALLARGVLDAASSRRLRLELERLRDSELQFGLCHADISLRNALVDDGDTPWLIDWGSAAVHVVPHYDINEILHGSKPEPDVLSAFLSGYGLSRTEYEVMIPDLRTLWALREVDTLRWAIDRKPDMIAEMTVRAKAAVAKLE
jgi:Ser/Thr protein kinase RdoA (MazF antagonist)